MKTKLLKNEEDILFLCLNTYTVFFFSLTGCPTEEVSSRSNIYYCRSLSDDQRLFPDLLLVGKTNIGNIHSNKTIHHPPSSDSPVHT